MIVLKVLFTVSAKTLTEGALQGLLRLKEDSVQLRCREADLKLVQVSFRAPCRLHHLVWHCNVSFLGICLFWVFFSEVVRMPKYVSLKEVVACT